MTVVELVFPVRGTTVPTDHAYPLYAALSAVIPAFHEPGCPLRFAPITGVADPEGHLRIDVPHAFLRVRLPDDAIRLALPLAGKRLDLNGHTVRLGVPSVRTLVTAPAVVARIVTFKNADTPEQFLTTARVKLAERGVSGEPTLPIHLDGPRAGEPKRRVVRIGETTIVGYALLVSELSAEHSMILQAQGLGGRTHMGCGYFVPAKGVL